MKILLGEKEYELMLTGAAVEVIEEHFDKNIEDVFDGKMRAKDYNFILWACLKDAPDLETTKKLLAEKHSYKQCIELVGKLLGDDPNAEGADTAQE